MRIELLLERVSDVVFHATSVKNVISILNSDKFVLSPAFTGDASDPKTGAKSDSELDTKGRAYFLSTARTRTSIQFAGESNIVLLVLDGRKLSHNYSGKAVDYWDADIRKQLGGAYEEEDRIFSDKPSIDNASQYIQSIDILEPRWGNGGTVEQGVIDLYKLAQSKGIPVRVYNNKQDWYSGSDRHIPMIRVRGYEGDSPGGRSFEGLEADMNTLLGLLDSVNHEEGLRFLHRVQGELSSVILDGDADKVREHIRKLLSLVGSVKDGELRKDVEELGEIMKDRGLKNSKELADYIVRTWVS